MLYQEIRSAGRSAWTFHRLPLSFEEKWALFPAVTAELIVDQYPGHKAPPDIQVIRVGLNCALGEEKRFGVQVSDGEKHQGGMDNPGRNLAEA